MRLKPLFHHEASHFLGRASSRRGEDLGPRHHDLLDRRSENSKTLWMSSSSVWSSTPLFAALLDQVLDLLLRDERAMPDFAHANRKSTARVEAVRNAITTLEKRASMSSGQATITATVSVKRRARALGTSSPRISST